MQDPYRWNCIWIIWAVYFRREAHHHRRSWQQARGGHHLLERHVQVLAGLSLSRQTLCSGRRAAVPKAFGGQPHLPRPWPLSALVLLHPHDSDGPRGPSHLPFTRSGQEVCKCESFFSLPLFSPDYCHYHCHCHHPDSFLMLSVCNYVE